MHFLLAALTLLPQTQPSDKLDPGLETATGMQPIFVRMENQLFKKAGDFEAFAKQNETTPRSQLQKTILTTLHKNADQDWEKIKSTIQDLEAKGQIKDPQRFWIVNGFACDATPEACKILAAHDDVSFVYRQTGPARLRQHAPRAADPSAWRGKKEVLRFSSDYYSSDADKPFVAHNLEIPWNLKQVQADKVWDQGVTGKGSVVAVNDGGMYELESLLPALWRNEKEELDGKDTDGNGYIDDIFGWDAAAQNGYVLGNEGVHHGTFCAGIIAGRPTSEKNLVTGVAPRSQIMLINGMGYLSGFEYALTNGADVFSMSYMFVNMEIGNYRGVFRLAAEHATAAGMLLCGGAGNFATSAPEGKQITLPKDIPCVLAAAGTQEDGTRPDFSSKGPVTWAGVKFYDDYPASKPLNKPDVSAPAAGFPVWGLEGNLRPAWKAVYTGKNKDVLITGPRGNSFAGPHTAGVAALMFSANPDLNPWQVKRIIEETAKDMGEPGRDVLHGAGLLQALPAVQKAKALKTSSR